MIPYDIDPSLHDGQPHDSLDDGFSPPPHHEDAGPLNADIRDHAIEAALSEKSDF